MGWWSLWALLAGYLISSGKKKNMPSSADSSSSYRELSRRCSACRHFSRRRPQAYALGSLLLSKPPLDSSPPPPHPLPPLLQLKLQGPDAVESRAHKRCPVEPPRPTSGSRSQYVSLCSASSTRREASPPSSSRRRAGRPSSPPPSKVRRRARLAPHRSITQRLTELQCDKRPRRGAVDAAESTVDDKEEGEMARSLPRSHYLCKHPEASLAAVELKLDLSTMGDGQELDNRKMEALSRSSCRKKIRRKNRAEAKNEMRELKLQVPYAVKPCSPKRCSVELHMPAASSQRRYGSPSSSCRPQEEHLPWSSMSRAARPPPSRRSPLELLPSTVHRHQEKTSLLISPPLAELQHAKELHHEAAPDGPRRGEVEAAKQTDVDLAAVDGREELYMACSSWHDESIIAKQPSHRNYNCQHLETSSATVERLDPAIRGDKQKLDGEKMGGKDQNDCKNPSRSARRKKTKRQFRRIAEELTEMKKEKLLQKVKKLQACVWLLEKESAGRPEIMEIRSLLESAEQQYEKIEAQSVKEGSSPLHEGLDKYEEIAGDKILVNLLKAVSKQNELAEEVNHLKSELQVVRQDRDYQLAQVQSLMADIGKQKEMTRRCGVELENAMSRASALEEECLLQRETARTLQIQLAYANVKLKVSSSTKDRC